LNDSSLVKALGWNTYNSSEYKTTNPAIQNVLNTVNLYIPGQLEKNKIGEISGRNLYDLHLSTEFIPDFTKVPGVRFTESSKLMGDITYEEYQTQWNGITFRWLIAHDKEGRVWIKNIYIADSKLSDYGNYSTIFPAGIFASKPLDYSDQVDAINLGFQLNDNQNYKDITPFLDYLLPIRMYRQAKGN